MLGRGGSSPVFIFAKEIFQSVEAQVSEGWLSLFVMARNHPLRGFCRRGRYSVSQKFGGIWIAAAEIPFAKMVYLFFFQALKCIPRTSCNGFLASCSVIEIRPLVNTSCGEDNAFYICQRILLLLLGSSLGRSANARWLPFSNNFATGSNIIFTHHIKEFLKIVPSIWK